MNNTDKAIENSNTNEEPVSSDTRNKTKLNTKPHKDIQKENFFDNFLVSNSNNIIFYGIIVIIVIAVIYLLILSFIIRDFDYPINHPFLFTLETLLMSVGISSIVFFMAWGRNAINYDTFMQFLVVVLKFGILHILFQFSGIYSYILGASNKSISKYIMHSNPAFY
jgi:hypothetical protein